MYSALIDTLKSVPFTIASPDNPQLGWEVTQVGKIDRVCECELAMGVRVMHGWLDLSFSYSSVSVFDPTEHTSTAPAATSAKAWAGVTVAKAAREAAPKQS